MFGLLDKKYRNFIPRKTESLILLSIVVGVVNFAIESSMVIILQSVLVALGLMERSTSSLPDFYPTGILPVFFLVATFGFARSLTTFLRLYLAALSQHGFTKYVRQLILDVAIKRGFIVSHTETLSLFSEIVTQSGNVIYYSSLIVSSFICAIFLFLLGSYLSPLEMILGVIGLALVAIPYAKYSSQIKKSGVGLALEWGRINEVVLRVLKNNFFIKIYRMEDVESKNGNNILCEYEGHLTKYSFLSAIFTSLPGFMGIVIVCVITVLGKEYFNTDSIKLLAFYYLFVRFSQFASEGYSSLSFFLLNLEGIKRLFHWLEENKKDVDVKVSKSMLSEDEKIEISFEDVGFGFTKEMLFKNINLKITEGDFLLIKGKSGSGKSTLLNIVFGLIEPSSGRVLFNSHENIENLSDFVSYVGPEPYLIADSVKNNLRYGNKDEISEEDMFRVLKLVGLENLVDGFSQGLDYQLGDHAQISTGQRQRLAMARALLRNKKILILDEATSNIDQHTEEKITNIIDKMKKKMVVIAVSHRDSFDHLATHRLDLGEKHS